MSLIVVAVLFGVVIFGGMFFGLFVSYQDIERKREASRAVKRMTTSLRAPAFYGWRDADGALTDELMLRQIEHHLRREALMAEQFIRNPTAQTLRAGEHLRLGAN